MILALLAAAPSCGRRGGAEPQSLEEILAQMRSDREWIAELDSIAGLAIGPGAKCIDPVWHLFSWEGRRWFHNQDWGGVLELPEEFVPEDDRWQAELSFHGTSASSTDSLMRLSFYAGFGAFFADEYEEAVMQSLEEEGFRVLDVSRSSVDFGDGTSYHAVTIRARSAEGVNYYERAVPSGPDGVQWSAALQYDDAVADCATMIVPMVDRYPLGPKGRLVRGEAVK